MAKVRGQKPFQTKTSKADQEENELKDALLKIQQNKAQREQAFQAELKELCLKYGVLMSTQIVVTAQ